ncbi:MAG: outer membrane beta-barrel protein [Azoarcus sp.]|jgi:outer membrane protein|nr:outer membrane beta-barrel protein [Azoarcus sp.]
MRHTLLAATLALAFSGAAFAHEPGNFIVRAGAMHIAPDVDSSKIRLNGVDHSGSKAEVPSTTSLLNLTGTWIFAPHLGLELMLGGPVSYDIKIKGVSSGNIANGSLATVTQQPITASLQFFFLNPKSRFQPYVGVGLNYTSFYDERFKRRQKRLGFRRLELEDSVGWALQAGMDIALTDRLYLNAAAWKIDIDTKAKGKGHWGWGGNEQRVKFDMEIDPWMYFVGVGYKF